MLREKIINQLKNEGVVEESWDDDTNNRITVEIITFGSKYCTLVFSNYYRIHEMYSENIEKAVDKYIAENPRVLNLIKTEEYVSGIKEYLETNKVINLESCEDDGISYNDILDELDKQNIKYQTVHYFNENGSFENLASRRIYSNQFFIE